MHKLVKSRFARNADTHVQVHEHVVTAGAVCSSGVTQSRTMAYASHALMTSADQSVSTVHDKWRSFTAQVPSPLRPKTTVENYWAARTFTAEALLSMKTSHQDEMREHIAKENERRSQELGAIHQIHEAHHARIERLTMLLMVLVACLLLLIVYALVWNSRSSKYPKSSSPLHFTIPILSPFTSVTEHETSVISNRTLTIFSLISALLMYGCFRFWLTHRQSARR